MAYPVVMSKKHNGTVGWLSAETVEGTTQSFKAGQLVLGAASGVVNITVTGSTTGILGIAEVDASGTSGAAFPKVEIVEPGDILEMSLVNNSTTLVTAALSDLYKKYGLYVSGGSCYLDQNTATFGQIVGFVLDSNGAFTSRVLVTVLPANLIVNAGL